MKRNLEAVVEHLEELSTSDLVGIHNTYCQETRAEDEIFENDEDFFDLYFSKTMDAVRAIAYGEYDYTDDYIKFNGYGNLETTNNPEEWITISEIAEYILENEQYFDLEFDDEEVWEVSIIGADGEVKDSTELDEKDDELAWTIFKESGYEFEEGDTLEWEEM